MGLLSFDIFCRVVDNFGDIGVCWRLARQLADLAPNAAVRLWVDDLHSFQRLAPQVRTDQACQKLGQIDIVHWTDTTPLLQPHAVVIEAFACDLPNTFIQAMGPDTLWINLEYLSAESWIESCHTLPSVQGNGLKKYFFFPGFTPATGGLLREHSLLQDRDHWLAKPDLRFQLLQSLGLNTPALQALQLGARQVFLFSYPDAPATALLHSLQQTAEPSVMLVPEGVCPSLTAGLQGQVHLSRIPFTDQHSFDKLLWSSDLNFVRGEDSLVRAVWAGKPLVWQIYAQDEDAHLIKLDAWLKKIQANPGICRLMYSWNTGNTAAFTQELSSALQTENWLQWQASSKKLTEYLACMPDLVSSLMQFCTQQRRTG